MARSRRREYADFVCGQGPGTAWKRVVNRRLRRGTRCMLHMVAVDPEALAQDVDVLLPLPEEMGDDDFDKK